MVKLILCDLDGTLLEEENSNVPEEAFAQIERLLSKGVIFSPASGRSLASLKKLFQPIADDIYYICENGALVFDKGGRTLLGKTAMPHSRAMVLAHELMSLPETNVVLAGEQITYLIENTPNYGQFMTDIGFNVHIIKQPEECPEAILKCSAQNAYHIKDIAAQMIPKWKDEFKCAVSGVDYLDFNICTKADGIEILCKHVGTERNNIMAFGDNYNDVEMLSYSGIPYIMESASADLKEKFPRHCKSVADVLCKL